MNLKNVFGLLSATIGLSLLVACYLDNNTSFPAAPDYSNDRYWSIKDEPTQKIDVFFVHPTTYGPPANDKMVADLDNEELNMVTDRDTVQWITEAFKDSCNIFAPRYRQVNIEVMKMDDKHKKEYMSAGISDIENAFRYYLANLNKGRPFIIASHSQGSNILQEVLIKNPDLLDKSKLVAAYMPGWTFTDSDLEKMNLPLGESPDQTGCLLTWNTIGPGGISPTVMKGARCVNPLSWTTDMEEYPASMNRMARIFLAPGRQLQIAGFTAARINSQGALEIPPPRQDVAVLLSMSLGEQVYHRYDYDFFFGNVKENVELRCKAFMEKQ